MSLQDWQPASGLAAGRRLHARLTVAALALTPGFLRSEAMLEHFGVIAGVDTTDIPPMTHAVPLELPMRNDVVMPSLTSDEALKGTPKRDGDLIVVPAIIPGGPE